MPRIVLFQMYEVLYLRLTELINQQKTTLPYSFYYKSRLQTHDEMRLIFLKDIRFLLLIIPDFQFYLKNSPREYKALLLLPQRFKIITQLFIIHNKH